MNYKFVAKVYQAGSDPDNILLVETRSSGEWVINGDWPLSFIREKGISLNLLGYVECDDVSMDHFDYNGAIHRFLNGKDRMILDECKCCGHKKFRREDENASRT